MPLIGIGSKTIPIPVIVEHQVALLSLLVVIPSITTTSLTDFAPRPLLDNVLQLLLPNSLQVPRDNYEINIRFPVIDKHSLSIPFLLCSLWGGSRLL